MTFCLQYTRDLLCEPNTTRDLHIYLYRSPFIYNFLVIWPVSPFMYLKSDELETYYSEKFL